MTDKNRLKKWLQTAVVKTTGLQPFSFFYRLFYRMAIRHWTKLCKKFPQIKSVYLRDSLAGGDWTPGISDIDLTVVIRDGLSAEEEFKFLTSFWKSYEHCEKIFPMLGEVDVFDEHSMKTWSRYGVRGYQTRAWQLLHGEQIFSKDAVVSGIFPEQDALHQALKFFKIMFWQEFYRQKRPSWNLRRLTKKIIKYAVAPEQDALSINGDSLTRSDLLQRVLSELDQRLSAYRDKPSLSQEGTFIESVVFFPKGVFQPAQEPTYLVLIRDGLGREALRNTIDDTLKRFAGPKQPVIMPVTVFCYILRVQDALSFDEIVKHARIESGKDVISITPHPDTASRENAAIERYIHALSYPRRRQMLMLEPSRVKNSFIFQELIRLKMFLEKREYIGDRDALFRMFREIYPEYGQRIKKFEENGSRLEFFRFLKELTAGAPQYLDSLIANAH